MKVGDIVKRCLYSDEPIYQYGVLLEKYLPSGFKGITTETARVSWFDCSERDGAIEVDFMSVLEVVNESR